MAGLRVPLLVCASHRLQRKLKVHSYRIEGASAMRLFVAAVLVVAIFVVVVLLISRLFPYGAGWAGVCVAITCLYASAFGVWALLGNKTEKNARAMEGDIVQQHSLRDNLLYFAVAMAAVTIAIAVTIHDTERGIHRNLRNDWFVGFVLVQPELEKRRSPLVSIPPFGRGFSRHGGLSIRWRLGGARTSPHAPVHRLDEPTGISLGMVASPQCPLPFRPAGPL
jgi:hypothetical protein